MKKSSFARAQFGRTDGFLSNDSKIELVTENIDYSIMILDHCLRSVVEKNKATRGITELTLTENSFTISLDLHPHKFSVTLTYQPLINSIRTMTSSTEIILNPDHERETNVLMRKLTDSHILITFMNECVCGYLTILESKCRELLAGSKDHAIVYIHEDPHIITLRAYTNESLMIFSLYHTWGQILVMIRLPLLKIRAAFDTLF